MSTASVDVAAGAGVTTGAGAGVATGAGVALVPGAAAAPSSGTAAPSPGWRAGDRTRLAAMGTSFEPRDASCAPTSRKAEVHPRNRHSRDDFFDSPNGAR